MNALGVYELLILNERNNILYHYDLVNDIESDEAKIAQLEKTPRIQNLTGLRAALKEMNSKFSPIPTQNVRFFRSTFYKFSLLDLPSGIKIMLLSANNDIDFTDTLDDIHQSAYIELAQRNPLYVPNTIIKNTAFSQRVKTIFVTLARAIQQRPL